jgi:hypothetical protein
LERVAVPNRTEPVEPPACGGCGGDLTSAQGQIASSVQAFDIPTFSLAVTEYLMMRRTCGCGYATTADLPPGVRGGPTCYGPNVTAACTLLASQDVIGLERTADLMSALLGVEVSTGFISSCLARLDTALTTAEFEEALKAALRETQVLGTDETPAPLTEAGMAEKDCHNPHVYTVRTMCAYTGGGGDLVWYGAAGDRTKASISAFGILDGYHGALVRDDFGGYVSYDADLAAVQQCLSHLLRYLDDAYAIDPVVPGVGPSGRRCPADGDPRGQHRPHRRPYQPAPGPACPATPQLRHRRRGRDLHQHLPGLAQGQPPRPGPGQTVETQSPPSVDLHRAVRYPGDER